MTDYPNPKYPHPLFKTGLKLGNERVKLIEMGKSFGINGLIVLLLSCGCWCFVSLPHGAIGWPVIYDCVISQTSIYDCIIEINFLYFSNPKHMLWVLKRNVSMRRFF